MLSKRGDVGIEALTKPRLEWYRGVLLLLQQRSKHPREMVVTPKASTSLLAFIFPSQVVTVLSKRGDVGIETPSAY